MPEPISELTKLCPACEHTYTVRMVCELESPAYRVDPARIAREQAAWILEDQRADCKRSHQ